MKYPTRWFLQLIWHVHVAVGSTIPDMTTIFHVSSYGRFIEIKNNLTRKELRKSNEGSNFLGGSLLIEILYEPKYNLKDKDNTSIVRFAL